MPVALHMHHVSCHCQGFNDLEASTFPPGWTNNNLEKEGDQERGSRRRRTRKMEAKKEEEQKKGKNEKRTKTKSKSKKHN